VREEREAIANRGAKSERAEGFLFLRSAGQFAAVAGDSAAGTGQRPAPVAEEHAVLSEGQQQGSLLSAAHHAENC